MKAISELLGGIGNCSCGKEHFCPVENVVIERNALLSLPFLCKPYHHILLVADENTFQACGKKAASLLTQANVEILILHPAGEIVIPNEETIAEIESNIQLKTDLLIGVGSGVINDLCKHTSFEHHLPYFIIATAPSMDGFVSVGAALILRGMKITLNARPPKAVIADTEVLRNAPISMIRSGWGDIIGKYSCLNDWKLSALINGEYLCQQVWNLVNDTVHGLEGLAKAINNRQEEAVRLLMQALIVVGIAMSYVGNSRPASGSEHHLAHYFEITGILEDKPYFPHGVDVLYSSVITAELREDLLLKKPSLHHFNRIEWEENIRRIYHSSADGILELQNRLGWYDRDDSTSLLDKWDEATEILSQAPGKKRMLELVEQIGLNWDDFIAMYGEEKIRNGVRFAKDLKDRWTVLWLHNRYFMK